MNTGVPHHDGFTLYSSFAAKGSCYGLGSPHHDVLSVWSNFGGDRVQASTTSPCFDPKRDGGVLDADGLVRKETKVTH